MSELDTLVFISHASEDKQLARDYRDRLANLAIDAWVDEDSVNAGVAFPERLRRALARSSHLLVLLTSRWFEKRWTVEEVRLFVELRGRDTIALIPVAVEEVDCTGYTELEDRSLLYAWRETDADAIDWQLWCAISNQPRGPRRDWLRRLRQVQLRSIGRADFTTEEFLASAQMALNGSVGETGLAHLGWHGVRLGLSPAWLNEVWAAEAQLAVWHRCLEFTDGPSRASTWVALAHATERLGHRGEHMSERLVLEALESATRDAEACAIINVLARGSLAPETVAALRRWMDPDFAGAPEFDHERCPQARGFTRALERTIELLIAQADAEPTQWFAGFGSALIQAGRWWTAYFRALFGWANADPLRWSAVEERLELALEVANRDQEILPALAVCIIELDEPPPGLSAIVQRLLDMLRGRRGEDICELRLGLWRAIIETNPTVVFSSLGGALDRLEPWNAQLRATELLGLAAQEPVELGELIGRFARLQDPEHRALLFDACLSSPSDVPGPEQLQVDADPVVRSQVSGLLSALSATELQALQAAVTASDWTRAIEGRPAFDARLALYVLAREFAVSDHDPASCWQGLARCVLLLVRSIVAEALPYLDERTREDIPPAPGDDAPFDNHLRWWTFVSADLAKLGSDAVAAADTVNAELRWLHACLNHHSSDIHGRLRVLAAQLTNWFIATPEFAGRFMLRASDLFRHGPTFSPAFMSIRLFLENDSVSEALSLLPEVGPKRILALQVALRRVATADEAAMISHALRLVELTLHRLPEFLVRHPIPGAEWALWALLGRSFAVGVATQGLAAFEDRVAAALVRCYADNPANLLARVGAAAVMQVETEVRLVCAGLALAPDAYVEHAAALARRLGAEPAGAQALLRLLDCWWEFGRGEGMNSVSLEVLTTGQDDAVRIAAGRALIAHDLSATATLAIVRVALEHPGTRAALSSELERRAIAPS